MEIFRRLDKSERLQPQNRDKDSSEPCENPANGGDAEAGRRDDDGKRITGEKRRSAMRSKLV